MANAIVKAVLGNGLYKASEIMMTDPGEARLEMLKNALGVNVSTDNAEALKAETVILAIKPQMAEKVLPKLKAQNYPLFISVLAGTSIAKLEKLLPAGSRVLRTVPNTPAMVGAGITALCGGTEATEGDMQTGLNIFKTAGEAFVTEESKINAISAISGSGPAYIFMVIEALSDAGVKLGLPRDLAMKLAAATAHGAGKMALAEHAHPALLKDQVTSPGGTTIEALAVLEGHGMRAAFINAVQAAFDRAEEM
jgi:pyrroline-5-carboxylate reductase